MKREKVVGIVIILIGLFWIFFSKPLSEYAVRYHETFRTNVMPAKDWRIIIVFMGASVCFVGVLVLTAVVRIR